MENHESSFIYGDATVTYSANIDVPFYLQRDNAKVKTIFVVRDPISRMESHFRYSLGMFKSIGFETVDSVVSFALKQGSHLQSLRNNATALLASLNTIDTSKSDVISEAIALSDCFANAWITFYRFDECKHLLSGSEEYTVDSLHDHNKIYQYISKFYVPSGAKTKEERLTSLIIRTSIYFPGKRLCDELKVLFTSLCLIYMLSPLAMILHLLP